MACNCGKRRLNGGTSVNIPAQNRPQTTAATEPTQQTTPTARSRVEAARARVSGSRG